MAVCIRENAQRKINGLSPVAPGVVETVLRDGEFWQHLRQFHQTIMPIVNAIGNLESRQATLADCMLEFIRCARAFIRIPLEEGHDEPFWTHAKLTFNTRFHAMNTEIHQLALFLHPLCRKLAVSQAASGRNREFMARVALEIAQKWRWSGEKASRLTADIKAYHECQGDFSGGEPDGLRWWEMRPMSSEEHPLKGMAITLFSIVPHAAEVERLFSQLGGVQGTRRCKLSVRNFEALGKIRSNLSYQLWEAERARTGKIPRRRHAHMHTRPEPGIDADVARELEENFTWTPPLVARDAEEPVEIILPEEISEDELMAEWDRFEAQQREEQVEAAPTWISHEKGVLQEAEYSFKELEKVDNRTVMLTPDLSTSVVNFHAAQDVMWDIDTLLNSM